MREIIVCINERQYIIFILDPEFYKKYGEKQYAFYECVAGADDEAEHYATVYLPTDLNQRELIGTIAHEAARVALDRHQTAIATMGGNIVDGFWREYER